MNEDIEYLLHNYLRSKGNLRALKQLLTVLESLNQMKDEKNI